MDKLATIILAAGQGKRMQRKDIPKVLNTVLGKPMVQYAVELALAVGSEKVVVVIGHQGEKIQKALADFPVDFVWQRERLGTGHAVLQAASVLENFEGNVLVLYGDVPLLTQKTIQHLLKIHETSGADLTMLTTDLDDPAGYGRIIRHENGKIEAIVEDRDASPDQKAIKEINPGIYVFKKKPLFEFLPKLSNRNTQGEYYLTDLVGLFQKNGYSIEPYKTPDAWEILGVNTAEHLKEMEKILSERNQ
ncbi:bifunctional protein GlmU [bacterium BMS3Abin05]|nr:bifunctional protein GlmU [bacterium BMS3Abin05]GBE28626.1 bifunctional protein GlmU [bacterium BMS3Bbin03]